MAKEAQRQQARILYIDQCLTAKEIAARLKVAEKTVGKWVDVGNWKDLRLSKQTSSDVLASKYNELLSNLLDKRLKLEKQPTKTEEDKSNYSSIVDEMSKISAIIDRIQKDGRVSLRTHIHCLEKFFSALQLQNRKLLTPELTSFQLEYLDLLADELK